MTPWHVGCDVQTESRAPGQKQGMKSVPSGVLCWHQMCCHQSTWTVMSTWWGHSNESQECQSCSVTCSAQGGHLQGFTGWNFYFLLASQYLKRDIKGGVDKMWALSVRKWEIWLPGIWRRLCYSSTFFTWVFTGKSSNHTTQGAESRGRDWKNGEQPSVEDQVWDHLRNVKLHKSWNLRRHICVCPEGTGGWSCWAPVHHVWEAIEIQSPCWLQRWNKTSIFKKGEKRRCSPVPSKMMEEILQETVLRHMET